MNGAHDTALDGSIVVKSLCHRSKAVGGAGCSGNDGIFSGQSVLVNAENDGLEVIACGCGNNDFLCACINVSLALLLGAVEACAFENNVNADLAPGKLVCLSHSIDLEGFAVNCDGTCLIVSLYSVKTFADLAAVAALRCIVLEQLSKHRGLGKIVDSDNFVAFSTEHLSESETANAAKTINSNFY